MATLPSISYTIGEYFVQNQMSLLIYLPVKTRYVYKERVFTYENKRYEKSIDADCRTPVAMPDVGQCDHNARGRSINTCSHRHAVPPLSVRANTNSRLTYAAWLLLVWSHLCLGTVPAQDRKTVDF